MADSDAIHRWIARIAEPRREFGGLPVCPWAKRAVWAVYETPLAFWDGFFAGVEMFKGGFWDALLYKCRMAEVPVRTYDRFEITREITVLISDPRRPTVIAGYRTTQRDALLYIFQWRDELEAARKRLEGTGYYSHFDHRL